MYQAYLDCRRSKRNKPEALAFERDYEANLVTLVEELREQRYQPSTSTLFYTEKPKLREIFAAAFRDRIVHHLIYNEISPQWERIFIHHSYACRPNKGTHAAALILQHFLRQATLNGKQPAFFLKLDIHNFFMTLNPRATRLGSVSNGVDFAGFIVRQNYALVRRRVVGNLKAKRRRARPELVRQTSERCVWRFHPETLAASLAAVNSYLGHFGHAQSRRLIKKLWQEFSFLRHFFKLAKYKLTRIDQPLRRKSDLKQQVRWLQQNFGEHICLIQIGCYYEAFGPQAKILAGALGLTVRPNWRGFGWACGFPQQHWPKMAAKLEKLRMPVVIARQTGRELYHAKERLPALIVEYSNHGINPANRQYGLAPCKSRAFISSATIVARPIGVRPISFRQFALQRKWSSPLSLRGLNRLARLPVLGSAAAVRFPLALLQWEQAKHKLPLVV